MSKDDNNENKEEEDNNSRLYAGTILLAVRAPDLSKKEFIPLEVGVIGIYPSYLEARKAKQVLQDKWEFRNHKLVMGNAPIIRSEKDIRYPIGFDVAN